MAVTIHIFTRSDSLFQMCISWFKKNGCLSLHIQVKKKVALCADQKHVLVLQNYSRLSCQNSYVLSTLFWHDLDGISLAKFILSLAEVMQLGRLYFAIWLYGPIKQTSWKLKRNRKGRKSLWIIQSIALISQSCSSIILWSPTTMMVLGYLHRLHLRVTNAL